MEEENKPPPKLSRTGTVILEPEKSPKMMKRTSSAIAAKYPSRLLHTSSVFAAENNNNGVIVPTDDYDLILTKDILFFIFTLLSRKDLITVRGVCKKWKAIANDPYFGWSVVASWKASISTTSQFDPTKSYSVKQAYSWGVTYYLVDDSGHQIIDPIDVVYHWEQVAKIDDVLSLPKDSPNLWRIFVEFKEHTKRRDCFNIVAEVRVKELERLVSLGEFIPGGEIITNRIIQEDENVVEKKFNDIPTEHKKPHIPMVSDIAQPQPSGLAVSLKKYQLDSLSWMKSLELRIRDQDPFKCATVIPWRSGRCDVVLDVLTRKFVTFQNIKEHYQPVYARGGVLGDEMGLGKTMELIALILANPSPPLAEMGERSIAEDDIGKRIPMVQPDKDFAKLRFNSRATLVLCPNHLASQWQSEIEKHTKSTLKVLLVTTITQLNKYSYKDMMEADVVIASFQLLKNPRYFRIGHDEIAAPRVNEEVQRQKWVISRMEEIRKKNKPEFQAGPAVLEHFYWYRLIIDEAHEVMDNFHITTFELYDYKYFWYVSGTPFPSHGIEQKVLDLLNFPPRHAAQYPNNINESLQWLQLDIMFSNLYWRNTKESVKNEYEIPAWVEELIVLDFTDTENAIYRDYRGLNDHEEARQLCSQIPKIEGTATLNAVRSEIIEQKRQRISEELSHYEKFKKELAALRRTSLKDMTRIQQNAHKRDMKMAADRVTKLALKLKQHASTLKLLIQANSFESRFAKICEALKWKVPKEYSKAIAEQQKYEKEMLKTCAKQIDMSGVTVVTVEMEKKESDNGEDDSPAQLQYTETLPAKLTKKLITRMSMTEMKEELRKRNEVPARGLKRRELKQKLYRWMEKEHQENPSKAELKRRLKQKAEKNSEDDSDSEKEPPKKKSKKKRGREVDEDEDKEPAAKKNVQKYDFTKKRTEVELLEELLNLVEEYGTKMGNLVYYLRRLWEQTQEARVILFSQFDAVLKEVGEILTNNDIKSAFVQGNVMRKNKAIKSFRSKDAVQVIMLSIEKAASGTNLIEASHVILMDPVLGSQEEAKAIESQAIGRAYRQGQSKQITVVRFVIRGTEEHTEYVQNYLQSDDSLLAARQKDLGSLHKAISEVNNPEDQEEIAQKKKSRQSLTKSASISNILVSSSLKAAGDVATLLEQSADIAVPPVDNTKDSHNNNNNNNNQDAMTIEQ